MNPKLRNWLDYFIIVIIIIVWFKKLVSSHSVTKNVIFAMLRCDNQNQIPVIFLCRLFLIINFGKIYCEVCKCVPIYRHLTWIIRFFIFVLVFRFFYNYFKTILNVIIFKTRTNKLDVNRTHDFQIRIEFLEFHLEVRNILPKNSLLTSLNSSPLLFLLFSSFYIL